MELKPQVKIDSEGYVEELTLGGNIGGIEFEPIEEPSEYIKNYRAYKFVGGKLVKDLEREKLILIEEQKNLLRRQRQIECFNTINRGVLWYDMLNEKQKEELRAWYQLWLDVTETLVIPERPSWLN